MSVKRDPGLDVNQSIQDPVTVPGTTRIWSAWTLYSHTEPLKIESYHNTNFIINGSIGIAVITISSAAKWRQSWQYHNSRFSVTVYIGYNRAPLMKPVHRSRCVSWSAGFSGRARSTVLQPWYPWARLGHFGNCYILGHALDRRHWPIIVAVQMSYEPYQNFCECEWLST